MIKESYIFIDGLRLHAKHGVLPLENIVGNDYIIDLRIDYPIAEAAQNDDIKQTISYADALQIIKETMKSPSKLLENTALKIAQNIIDNAPDTHSVWIKLTKINPPMGADCDGAGVCIQLINNKTKSETK